MFDYYAPAPVSKFNSTNKLTKMRAIPQRKQYFPVSTRHESTLYWHCSIHLSALVDSYRSDYLQGLNLDIDVSVQKGV